MKIILIMLIISLAANDRVFSQQKILDIPALHQLVNESESENKLQVKAKNQQALTTANEQANLTLLEKTKGDVPHLTAAVQYIGNRHQHCGNRNLCYPNGGTDSEQPGADRPVGTEKSRSDFIGYQSALQFASQAKSLVAYVTGLSLSLGDVNQMKASDRKILFDYVISELSNIQNLSGNMLNDHAVFQPRLIVKVGKPISEFY
jgi:hypothetical protein